MAYYHICQKCGAYLDPNEKCDCESVEVQKQRFYQNNLVTDSGSGQMFFNLNSMEDSYEKKNYQ